MLCPIHRLTANCGKVIAHSFSQDERSVCHNRAHGSTLAFAQMRRTRRMTAPLPPMVTSGVSPSPPHGIDSKRSRSSAINFGVIGTTRSSWPSHRSVLGLWTVRRARCDRGETSLGAEKNVSDAPRRPFDAARWALNALLRAFHGLRSRSHAQRSPVDAGWETNDE
ncbi:MAG: hypothetical protein KJZ65_09405 [Phycisphaerales bacterium]|nr:hypothetical protein [Phycisphaerales bacterium]